MIKKNYYVLITIAICIVAQSSLSLGLDVWQYAKVDVEAGQWWRFLTANFVHLGWRHLFMNAVGLIFIALLFPKAISSRTALLVLLLCGLGVTIGIWMFCESIRWYVGLSGALHGLLIVLIVMDYQCQKNVLNLVLLGLVILKLAWESVWGPLPGSESTAGGTVVEESHLYGAIAGTIIGIVMYIKKSKFLTG